jgi:hypothetical protein
VIVPWAWVIWIPVVKHNSIVARSIRREIVVIFGFITI